MTTFHLQGYPGPPGEFGSDVSIKKAKSFRHIAVRSE